MPQIHCTAEARLALKIMAKLEGRTLSGYLTSLANQEKRRWPKAEFRKAGREILGAKF